MIYLGTDHAGFLLKEKIKTWLKNWGYEYKDLGSRGLDPQDDFPDFAIPVAQIVAKSKNSFGILICGTGVGMDIAANKVSGARSVLAINPEHVRHSKKADHTNILSLAAHYTSEGEIKKIIKSFLETDYGQEERYLRRLKKVEKLENKTA